MSLLSLFTGAGGEAKRLVAGYADEPLPHYAPAGTLTPEQRAENLAAFRASLERRVARFQAFAAALGTDLPLPDGDRAKVDGIAQALDRLFKTRLLGLTEAEALFNTNWSERPPEPTERRFRTLIHDAAAYCGEVAIRCQPKYAWTTDEARYRPATLMKTAGRVVVGHDPAVMAKPMKNPVDLDRILLFQLGTVVRHRKAKSLWPLNVFSFLTPLADGLQV